MSKDNQSDTTISPAKLQEQINLLRKDMIDMTGFITQEFIKAAQANGGKLLNASSSEHTQQVTSLLNADPQSAENQGKPVLSIKGTEQGIDARIDKLIMENGASPPEFNDLKKDMAQIRKEFESKALSDTGLKELVDNRIRDNLLLQNAVQFMKLDKNGSPTGMSPGEKQGVINQIKDHVIVTDFIRDSYLNSDKTKGEKVAAATTNHLANVFSVEGNNNKGFSTLDPAKLTPENMEKFSNLMKTNMKIEAAKQASLSQLEKELEKKGMKISPETKEKIAQKLGPAITHYISRQTDPNAPIKPLVDTITKELKERLDDQVKHKKVNKLKEFKISEKDFKKIGNEVVFKSVEHNSQLPGNSVKLNTKSKETLAPPGAKAPRRPSVGAPKSDSGTDKSVSDKPKKLNPWQAAKKLGEDLKQKNANKRDTISHQRNPKGKNQDHHRG